jgi:hypothetical protein
MFLLKLIGYILFTGLMVLNLAFLREILIMIKEKIKG